MLYPAPTPVPRSRVRLVHCAAAAGPSEAKSGLELSPRSMLELLTVAALVIYGAVRFADSAFYARLGATPDDVGLDYAHVLGRVAGSVALMSATLAILLSAGWFVRRANWPMVTGALGVGTALLRAMLPPTSPLVAMAMAAIVLIAGAFARRAREASQTAGWLPTLTRARLVIVAAVGIVVIFGYAGISGYRAAGYVYNGQELPCGCSSLLGHNITLPWASASEGFMGVEASPADVRWISPNDHKGDVIPGDLMYLGVADELVALYDPVDHVVVRLPVAAVSVRLTPRRPKWDEAR
jgi:hypothetical protein